MTILFLLILVLVVLNIAVYCWGVNSSDGVNSPEWERRQQWLGFH